MKTLGTGTRVASSEFLMFDDADAMHRALTQLGFSLLPLARVYNCERELTVRLVWRRRDRQSAVLALRMRVGQ